MSLEVPTQESAQHALDRILRIAVSGRLRDDQRVELGRAVAWLQGLIDCDVLPPRPPRSPASAAPGVATVARAGLPGGVGQGEPGVGRIS